jgi:ATP-binding cassette, subfamily B, bacterial
MGPQSRDLRVFGHLLRDARPLWPHLLLILLLSLSAAPIALLVPLPLKLVTDCVLGDRALPPLLAGLLPQHAAGSPRAVLILCVALLIAISLLQHIEGFASWLLQSYTGERLVLRSRIRLFEHAQRLSLDYHDRVGTADSIYRIHDDAVPAHYLTVSGLVPLVSSSCVLFALICTTAWLDWKLAVIAMTVVPVLALLTDYYRHRVRAGWAEVRAFDASAMSVLQEVLGALRVVKAFGQEARERERYTTQAQKAMYSQLRVIAGEATFGLLIALTLALGTALVLFIGVEHVRGGSLSFGNLLLVMGYLTQLYKPVETISKKVAALQGSLASADRTQALLDVPSDVPEHPSARLLLRARGEFQFEGVSFRYRGGSEVLKDVKLTIPPGARVGIAGETGAGKTTLISLLLRFFDPSSGAILLDGVDLREYALADLRKQFALVLQEPILFSTTIAQNIAYGRPDATHEEIVQAARAARAHDFISALPDGYETRVGERGMTLSGGERQRIALARAFLRDAPVLILDEPTSAIDAKNEQAILEALEVLMRGRTTLIIAHRLNTLDNCDIRLEVANGEICRVGSREKTAPIRKLGAHAAVAEEQ